MNDDNQELKKKTISGLIWRFAERCGAKGVEFIVAVILARLLAPRDYGLIAMVTVFITISQVFIDSGMGNALIQKKDADDLDFSSVFYFNILICTAIYTILFVASPFIARFYKTPELTSVLRVLSVTIIISSLKNVQQAYVSKHMLFKKFFFSTLGGTFAAAVIGIVMAYAGWGVWALVAQQIMNALIDMVILWITVKWRPIKAFSLERLKSLFSFGWKLLVSAIVDTTYNNVRQLIIGRVYSSADLAYYNRGRQIPNLVVTNINASIDSVLLPALSEEQNNVERVKMMTRRAIKTSSYIMWPLMLGLVVVAEPLTRLLLTEKWIESVPYLQIFCLVFAFQPVQTANLNAIKAMGRSDLFLRLEIIKKSIGLLILSFVMKHGVFAIAVSLLVYTFVAQILNSFPNKKLLNYSYLEQLKDIWPYIGLASFMLALIYPISLLGWNDISTLLIQVFSGIVIYIAGSILFKLDSFQYIWNIVKGLLRREHDREEK
ncbi:MAG: lipopolysaccharide biosynthesis protein [Lachnospiraceae bacterium]|nr:lipopolysaccharide biosynthesis protein [Lachnospiraceae bacterium]